MLRNGHLIFTLLMLIAGGFLIILCMYYNYRPLYNLIDLADSLTLTKSASSASSHNEIDNIAHMIRQLSAENTKLTTKLEDTKYPFLILFWYPDTKMCRICRALIAKPTVLEKNNKQEVL